MLLEQNVEAAPLKPLHQLLESRADPICRGVASAAEGPSPAGHLSDEKEGPRRRPPRDSAGNRNGGGGEPRKSDFRRRPFAMLIATLLLAAVAVGGYVYWDSARHLATTDDGNINQQLGAKQARP